MEQSGSAVLAVWTAGTSRLGVLPGSGCTGGGEPNHSPPPSQAALLLAVTGVL